MTPTNNVDVELQTYLKSPRVDIDPVSFRSQRSETSPSTLALQIFSVPSSSAPVERLLFF